jgi:hypothetical protein
MGVAVIMMWDLRGVATAVEVVTSLIEDFTGWSEAPAGPRLGPQVGSSVPASSATM